jgi:hypothetical protein
MNSIARFHWTTSARWKIIHCPTTFQEPIMSVHRLTPQPLLSRPNLSAPQVHRAVPKRNAAVAFDAPWFLPNGHAVTVQPRRDAVLRAVSGRAWATLDASGHNALAERSDHFVVLGHDLPVHAGQRVVVEAWPTKGQDGIQLQWVAQPQTSMATRWQTSVREPLRDMGHGLALVARALGRLLGGIAGYADVLAAGRGRVLRGLESNAP